MQVGDDRLRGDVEQVACRWAAVRSRASSVSRVAHVADVLAHDRDARRGPRRSPPSARRRPRARRARLPRAGSAAARGRASGGSASRHRRRSAPRNRRTAHGSADRAGGSRRRGRQPRGGVGIVVAIGSSARLPEVITSGGMPAQSRAAAARGAASRPPSRAPGATPAASRRPSADRPGRRRRSTIGRSRPSSSRRSCSSISAMLPAAAVSATITARGLPDRPFRSRSSVTAASLVASQAR